MPNSSIAIVHGNYFQHGGAELVSDELARTFEAPLYYGFGKDSAEAAPADIEATSLFNDSPLSFLKRSILLRDLYYMWNFQGATDLHDYDVIIQSKNESGWYVPKDEQVVVKYIHTTPRTPYDLFHQKHNSFVSKAYSFASRVLYLPNTKYPDKYIANSELVARRVRRYWGVPEEKIEVVYPPTDVEQYGQRETSNYYLTYSRLVPAKRIDEIIRAFDGLDAKLIVGGKGEERKRLERIASDNVEFVGYMTEEEKVRRLGEAKALLFNARNEDFGMVPIEAFASGTPVIGVNDGYTKYQIIDGKNGVSHEPDAASIKAAIRKFEREGVSWSSDEIEEFAEQYGVKRFRKEMSQAVDEAIAKSRIDPHGVKQKKPIAVDGGKNDDR